MRTVAIIQARMASTRLPGKVLADIAGRPMLHWVVSRVRRAQSLDVVGVATSDGEADDVLVSFCKGSGFPVFRGSEDDVLDRYYKAASHFEADVVVRLTADCPLLDPAVIDKVVLEFRKGTYDYVSNTIEPSFPDGLDTEVFSRETLGRAWRDARLKSEREHVTPYIWKNPGLFRLGNVKNAANFFGLRWTVDEPEDLEFARRVYASLGVESSFSMNDVLRLIRLHPDVASVNAGFERNEGYQKSLTEDALITKSKGREGQ